MQHELRDPMRRFAGLLTAALIVAAPGSAQQGETKAKVDRRQIVPFEITQKGRLTDVAGQVVLEISERTKGILRTYSVSRYELRTKRGSQFILESRSDAVQQSALVTLTFPDGRDLVFQPGKLVTTPNLTEMARETHPGSTYRLGKSTLAVTLGEPLKPQLERKEARGFRDMLPSEFVELAELFEDAEHAFRGTSMVIFRGFSESVLALALGRDVRTTGKTGYTYEEIESSNRRVQLSDVEDVLPKKPGDEKKPEPATAPTPSPEAAATPGAPASQSGH